MSQEGIYKFTFLNMTFKKNSNLIIISNHLQQYNDIASCGMVKYSLFCPLSVHKMLMQSVAVAVDGSVLKLPPFANQEDWTIIFSQAIYII